MHVNSLAERYLTWTTEEFALGAISGPITGMPGDEVNWYSRYESMYDHMELMKLPTGQMYLMPNVSHTKNEVAMICNRYIRPTIASSKNLESIMRFRFEVAVQQSPVDAVFAVWGDLEPTGTSPDQSVEGHLKFVYDVQTATFKIMSDLDVLWTQQVVGGMPTNGANTIVEITVYTLKGSEYGMTYCRTMLYINNNPVAASPWLVDDVENIFDEIYNGVGLTPVIMAKFSNGSIYFNSLNLAKTGSS